MAKCERCGKSGLTMAVVCGCCGEPPVAGAARGSAENVQLSNDTKIRFCNTFDAIKAHIILCKDCDMYLRWGDGDLCSAGKTIIAMEMAYSETTPEFLPNNQLSDGPAERVK